jgi:hypothetical protein
MPDTGTAANWQWWHTAALIGVIALFIAISVIAPWSLYASWIVAMIVLTLFTLVVGHGVTGVWMGALIDDRNRMSLSRLQMLLWTVVIVSAFGTIAIGRLHQTPLTQADILGAMDIGVPQTIWLLLGISTASFIGSPLIKNTQKDPNLQLAPDRQNTLLENQGKDPATVTVEGQIVKNKSMQEATFADLFMGETVENANHLEVGKMQMFFFTALIMFAYAFAIGASLKSSSVPSSLPDIGSGMLPLLGLSHGGYLASKATAQTTVEQPQPAR